MDGWMDNIRYHRVVRGTNRAQEPQGAHTLAQASESLVSEAPRRGGQGLEPVLPRGAWAARPCHKEETANPSPSSTIPDPPTHRPPSPSLV